MCLHHLAVHSCMTAVCLRSARRRHAGRKESIARVQQNCSKHKSNKMVGGRRPGANGLTRSDFDEEYNESVYDAVPVCTFHSLFIFAGIDVDRGGVTHHQGVAVDEPDFGVVQGKVLGGGMKRRKEPTNISKREARIGVWGTLGRLQENQ